jgi:hypothetical protein
VSAEVDVWDLSVVQLNGVDEVVFAVSSYRGDVVEFDVDDFAGFAV